MHATFEPRGRSEPARGIQGTFYPSERQAPSASMPKLVALLIGFGLLRAVIGRAKRGATGSGRWSRRRDVIAQIHRDLHAADAQPGAPASAVDG